MLSIDNSTRDIWKPDLKSISDEALSQMQLAGEEICQRRSKIVSFSGLKMHR